MVSNVCSTMSEQCLMHNRENIYSTQNCTMYMYIHVPLSPGSSKYVKQYHTCTCSSVIDDRHTHYKRSLFVRHDCTPL